MGVVRGGKRRQFECHQVLTVKRWSWSPVRWITPKTAQTNCFGARAKVRMWVREKSRHKRGRGGSGSEGL